MEKASQYSAASRKSFIVFLFVVVLLLLGVIAYMGMYAKDLETEIITAEEAQSILDTLPENPDATGLSPKDKAGLLQGLGSGE